MSFIASTGSQGKWMESISENVETVPGHGEDEQRSVVPVKPPTLPRSWTRFQYIKALEEDTEEVATSEDPLSIRENVSKEVFETYKHHQFTRGTAHPSQVVTSDQLVFIMTHYMEIEQFYAAETVATDLVKDTVGEAIVAVATKQETNFDIFEKEYFAAEDDVVGEEINKLIKDQWEIEMDQYYRDQRDLCDIMG